MPAKRLELGARARADLDQIWTFTAAQWDPRQADEYTNRLNAAMVGLANGSPIGHLARDNRYLVLRFAAHMIYFRAEANAIKVVRILHGQQLPERHLPPEA
ncbi:type II toxin-antitoxin system RelE/ParE family toxin [Sphingomonas sp.]|jgi:toxin ParE1/3/4|uniref:type II toxin-antitoxin system RelE/ParE family toxin n=1 Tax=Sphingomonas sp. TaxID=28214 RepID=UPI002D7F040E|nr:type II toxin-antitoxin system RelE/ParE family toxin [Sphingomonas sp.]HEU0043109.1 type II toxin-antitoxin system RelE/ParE family toxin [Sphingomonas sp.]